MSFLLDPTTKIDAARERGRVLKATADILKQFPHFSRVTSLWGTDGIRANSEIQTFRTDGRGMEYSPAYCSRLRTVKHVQAVVLHEMFHTALGHHLPFRREGLTNNRKMQVSFDAAIHGDPMFRDYIRELGIWNEFCEIAQVPGVNAERAGEDPFEVAEQVIDEGSRYYYKNLDVPEDEPEPEGEGDQDDDQDQDEGDDDQDQDEGDDDQDQDEGDDDQDQDEGDDDQDQDEGEGDESDDQDEGEGEGDESDDQDEGEGEGDESDDQDEGEGDESDDQDDGEGDESGEGEGDESDDGEGDESGEGEGDESDDGEGKESDGADGEGGEGGDEEGDEEATTPSDTIGDDVPVPEPKEGETPEDIEKEWRDAMEAGEPENTMPTDGDSGDTGKGEEGDGSGACVPAITRAPYMDRLASLMNVVAEDSRSYYRPNRKLFHISQTVGGILPGSRGMNLGNILVLVDTSYSMRRRRNGVMLFEHALNVINDVVTEWPHVTVTLVQMDTDIKNISEMSTHDFPLSTPPEWHGGGGTDPVPGLLWAKDNASRYSAVLVVSDMEFYRRGWDWDETNPGIPVMWCHTEPAATGNRASRCNSLENMIQSYGKFEFGEPLDLELATRYPEEIWSNFKNEYIVPKGGR